MCPRASQRRPPLPSVSPTLRVSSDFLRADVALFPQRVDYSKDPIGRPTAQLDIDMREYLEVMLTISLDANLFKDAFVNAQKENEALFPKTE